VGYGIRCTGYHDVISGMRYGDIRIWDTGISVYEIQDTRIWDTRISGINAEIQNMGTPTDIVTSIHSSR